MGNNRIKLYFGNKDDLLKSWFVQAADQGCNVSYIVCGAVRYYYDTGEYMSLGKVVKKIDIPNFKKHIYTAPNLHIEEIEEEYKERKLKVATMIKRIVLRGIEESSDENIVVTDEYVYDMLEGRERKKERLSVEKMTYSIPSSSKDNNTDSVLEKEEQRESSPYVTEKKKVKREKDFILSIIPEGCGLGE